MKRSIISFILISLFVFCFGLSFAGTQNDLSIASADYSQFYSQVAEVCKESNLEYTYIEKGQNLSTLSKNLTFKGESIDLLDKNKTLSSQEIENICQDNDYIVIEEDDGYMVRNQYSLKRLIAVGDIKNSYNANRVISGYRDFNILCYDTIEETKKAYQKLSQDKSIKVAVDSIISIENEETQSYDYDYSNYYSWGAKAIDLGVYNEYLQTYGVDNEIVVAVLDTGINTSHFLVKDRILKDTNGNYVGYSYYTSTYTYSGYAFEDDKGHGTHVSGTICELTPYNVKILPVKVLANNGKGDFSAIIGALSLLEDESLQNYQIASVNMSLGGEITDISSLAWLKSELENVFKALEQRNTISVVSAGNDSKDTTTFAPACCETPIVVSALMSTTSTTQPYIFDTSYSNFGESVDICAPGSSIVSAYIGPDNNVHERYMARASGTSMAAPHVSAAIALFACDNHYYQNGVANYTPDELKDRLFQSATDLGNVGEDIYYGYGMLSLKNHLDIIEYTVQDKEVTYDGKYYNINVTVTDPESYTITYGLTEGTYDITDTARNVNFKNYTNGKMAVYFKITADHRRDTYGVGYLTINQKELSVKVQDQTCTYGEVSIDQNKYTINSGSLVAGDSLNVRITTNATNTSPVGQYDLTLSYDNNNYKLNYTNAKLNIMQRDLSIKLTNQEITYGSLASIENLYTITSGKIVNSDDLGLILSTNATNTSNAGSYTITVKSYTNKNYNITATDGVLIVRQRDLSIKLSNQSSMYGESIVLDDEKFEITSGELVEGTSLGLTLKTNANLKSIGKYTIEKNSVSNLNYNLTITNGIYEVTKRQITITIDGQNYKYGENFTLDKTKYKVSTGSILSGDNLNINLFSTGNSSSKTGEYDIDLTYSNENYLVNVIKGILTITQRTIIVTFANTTYNYGETVSFDDVTYTLSGDSIVNNDEVNINISTTSNTLVNAGQYQIKATSSNRNYALKLVNNVITIKPIKISASFSQTGVYGDAINLDKSKCTLQGETINGDVLNFTLSTTATSKSDVGKYDVYANYSNTNYDISFVKGEYIITPRPVSITVYNQTNVYGNSINLNKTSAYRVVSGLVNGDELGVNLSTTATRRSSVGSYKISATIDNANYKLSYTAGKLEITKREIMIRLLDQSVPYSFDLKTDDAAYKVVSGSILDGDNLGLTIFADVNGFSLVGNYALYAECSNDNYSVKVISGTLNVEFSITSLLVIAIPVFLITGAGITVYFVRRRMKFNRYVHEDDDLL